MGYFQVRYAFIRLATGEAIDQNIFVPAKSPIPLKHLGEVGLNLAFSLVTSCYGCKTCML